MTVSVVHQHNFYLLVPTM